MLFKDLKKEHSIQPNTINVHTHSPRPPKKTPPTDIYVYPLKHIPPSSRRWGLTNRPFISCQSGFIGFKWSLITTVLQSLIMVFFFPHMGSGGKKGGVGSVCFPNFLTALIYLFAFHHIRDFPF